MSELHVVFGSGPIGRAVIDQLVAREKPVRLVKRSGRAEGLPAGVEVGQGDATDPASCRRACQDATHVYNCTNAPDYHKWPQQFPPLQAGVLAGAASAGAKLIVMENLYMYGPHGGAPMTEDTPLHGSGPRSSTRKQMTRDLFAAHERGEVRAVSGRASDFFGPRVLESWAGERVFGALLAGKTVQAAGNPDLPHTYTYAPDIGRALVILGERDEALGLAWHIPSPRTVSTREFVRLACEIADVPQAKISALPTWLFPVIGLFMPPLRGIRENAYLFNEPYVMDHSQFADAFGDIATPLEEALAATIAWYRARAA